MGAVVVATGWVTAVRRAARPPWEPRHPTAGVTADWTRSGREEGR
jgi:hypothetical protein